MKGGQNGAKGDFIKTYVRLKPPLMDENPVINSTRNQVVIQKRETEPFVYDEVFPGNSKNAQIFETVMRPIVSNVMEGYNACVLAYGQTSSGKTYTMKGVEYNPGLIPLTIRLLFEKIETEKMIAVLTVSYFQIYNEKIIDLLDDENPPRYLEVGMDVSKKKAVVHQLKQFKVINEGQALHFYQQGQTRRKFASNNINFNSSRSHTVFRITYTTCLDNYNAVTSAINMVDLAGSQSISKTNAVGLLKKESENINKSLLALSNVIRYLGQGQKYINFRDSKLTRILESCFIGNAQSAVICTVNQTEDCVGETINTLKFGLTARAVKLTAMKNIMGSNIKGRKQLDNDPRYDELSQIMQGERIQKKAFMQENAKLKAQLQFQRSLVKKRQQEIANLKHRLRLQQNVILQKQAILNKKNQMSEVQEDSKRSFAFMLQDKSVSYQQKINKLEKTVAEFQEKIKSYKKMNYRLEDNQKTLVDKIGNYQRELAALNRSISEENDMRNKIKPVSVRKEKTPLIEERRGNGNSRSAFLEDVPKARDNPYTVGKIMQLSIRMLEFKIQMKEYVTANAQLQEENQKLTAKVQFLEKNYPQPQDQTSVTRQSLNHLPGNKVQQDENRKLRKKLQDLRREKDSLYKKLVHVRGLLKKNASNHVDQLHGFNRFIDKNFTDKEKQYFEFMFEEDIKDFEEGGFSYRQQ